MPTLLAEPVDIARAWQDSTYRQSLPTSILEALPPNPAGTLEIAAEDLGAPDEADVSITGTIFLCIPFPSGDTCGIVCPTNAFTIAPLCCK